MSSRNLSEEKPPRAQIFVYFRYKSPNNNANDEKIIFKTRLILYLEYFQQ